METQPRILIIDDDENVQEVLKSFLYDEGYNFCFASTGNEGIQKAHQCNPDVILLDVMMPDMNGLEVCAHLRASEQFREIPILLITSLSDRSSRIEGLRCGADDFLVKPIDRAELRARIRTIIRLNRYRLLHNERTRYETLFNLSPDALIITDEAGIIRMINPAAKSLNLCINREKPDMDLIGNPFINLLPQQHATHYMEEYQSILEDGERTLRLETELYQTNNLYLPVEIHAKRFVWNENRYVQILIRDISERKLAEQQIKKAYDALQESLEETIVGWGRTLEKRDMETHGHTQRVTEITVAMAKKLGFTDDQLVQIRRGAALHDLGKIGIPDRILLKPAPLDEEEWEIMRKHPTYAYEMISSIFFLLPASIIPLYHHERWDGSGYPQGLKGEEIPLEARIFAIVDVWDALSSDRPYRKAWKRDKIIQYIRQNAGVLFDPNIVEVFLENIEQIEANLL